MYQRGLQPADALPLPAGSGTLSTAEERPLEEGPVTLELLGPSPGRSGERRLPTTVPGQVHQKQGRHPQQRENVAVSKVQAAVGCEQGTSESCGCGEEPEERRDLKSHKRKFH